MGPYLIKKIELDGILLKGGKVLDLGSGKGRDSLYFAQSGYEVDAVDKDVAALKEVSQQNPQLKLNVIETDIESYSFDSNTYSLIIASNSLPFIASKDTVKEVLVKCADALREGGVLYFSLFGTKDAWCGNKPSMSFFEENEARELVKSLPLKSYYQITEEGYGQTMAGDLKYWNIFKFILTK